MPFGNGPAAKIVDLSSFAAGPFIGPCCNWSPLVLGPAAGKNLTPIPVVHFGDVFPPVPPNPPCCPCGPGCCIPCLPLPRMVVTASPRHIYDGRPLASIGDVVSFFPFSAIIPAGPNKLLLLFGALALALALASGAGKGVKAQVPPSGIQDPGASSDPEGGGIISKIPKNKLPDIPRGIIPEPGLPGTHTPPTLIVPISILPPGTTDPGAVEDPGDNDIARECDPRIPVPITITITGKTINKLPYISPGAAPEPGPPNIYSSPVLIIPKSTNPSPGTTDPGAVEDPEVVHYCPPRIPETLVVVQPSQPKPVPTIENSVIDGLDEFTREDTSISSFEFEPTTENVIVNLSTFDDTPRGSTFPWPIITFMLYLS